MDTFTGQRRHLPCPEGERTPNFKHLWNQAVNFPIQGCAAAVVGTAILDLEQAILQEFGLSLEQYYDFLVHWWANEKKEFAPVTSNIWEEFHVPIITQEVHDEIMTDTPNENAASKVTELMRYAMEKLPTMRTLWPQTKDWVFVTTPTVSDRWGQ